MATTDAPRSDRMRRNAGDMEPSSSASTTSVGPAAAKRQRKPLRMPASAFLPLGDALRYFRCVVAYDGALFHGFQAQEGAACGSADGSDLRTVQLALEDALRRTTGETLRVRGASRTDRGVHANGQVVAFDSRCRVPDRELRSALNSRLPADLLCRSLRSVAAPFDPRTRSRGKTYEYLVHSGGLRPVLDRARVWFVRKTLDTDRMRAAAALLEGTHDFTSFSGAKAGKDDVKSGICTLEAVNIDAQQDDEDDDVESEEDNSTLIRIRFRGDRFLYKMVRNLVGTLVDVGLGKLAPAAMTDILAARSRVKAGQGAPPHGLTLLRVYYHEEETDERS
jgi:tRNA pseudouridine38-40 synthase